MSATRGKEDRISNLPDILIDSILEWLPIQDAVRTSILSKQWRYRWTTMAALVFDAQFSNKFAMNRILRHNGFIVRIINHVLFFHKGPILKFDLHIPKMLLNSFQEIDQCMLMLSRNEVRELNLINLNQHYRLPSFVFSCLELRKLHLKNCIMKPPLEFQGFPNLEDISLHEIDFEVGLGGTAINLPLLKSFSMYGCKNAYNFNIKATKLQRLCVVACPDITFIRLFDKQFNSLTTLRMHSLVPSEEPAQVKEMILAWMLSDVPNMEFLSIDGHFLKFYIAENIPKFLPHTIDSLKHLDLHNIEFGDLGQLQTILCMLRNSPNLENLYVMNQEPGLGNIHFDAEPTSYYLDQPLNNLQNIIIRSEKGLRVELVFIHLLLKHSPTLKKLKIMVGSAIDDDKRSKFAKDVMGFSRASLTVEVVMATVPIPGVVG